jgi:acetoin utilization protein AcuB
MSWVAWITDPLLPAASTLAGHLSRALQARGEPVVVLDAGHCRRLLAPGATGAADARPDIVDRAIVHVARLLADASIGVVLHGGGGREIFDLARTALPRFVTIRARRRGVETSQDLGDDPDLCVDVTDGTRGTQCLFEALAALVPPADVARPTGTPAWAIWITGISGSGKTTLAGAVAEALHARGQPVAIVDWDRLTLFAASGAPHSPHDAEVLRRALLLAAVLLTDAGVRVVIDAAGPDRASRDAARQHIKRFGEVQLLCDPDMAVNRDRAVRWGLTPCSRAAFRCDAPEGVLGYEPARAPELTLQTDGLSVAATTAAIVRLAERFDGAHTDATMPPKETPMLVKDLMTRNLITVRPQTNVTEARSLMTRERIRHLLVTEGRHLLGMVTDRDIRLNLPSPATSLSVWEINFLLAKLTVGEVMTKSVLIVDPARPAKDAARIMLDHRIGALPVVDGDALVGILTETDLVRAFAESGTPAPVGR